MELVRQWTNGRSGETRIHAAPETLSFSHWARDALIGVETDAGRAVLLSDRFERMDDAEAGRLLADAAGLPVIRSERPLDGGNILTMGETILVGADLFDDVPDRFPDDTGRRLIALGTSRARTAEALVPSDLLPDGWQEVRRTGVGEGQHQPLFHIDLFVSPAGTASDGRPRWLVGCPRLGADVLGLPLLDHADADLFDAVAAHLAGSGAEVIRNPQPLFWSDRTDARVRTWHHLPVNNVLAEITASGDATVWLPAFGERQWPELRRVDEANRDIWQSLGFEVIPVPGCLALAERRGALRCMCNVVARDPVLTQSSQV